MTEHGTVENEVRSKLATETPTGDADFDARIAGIEQRVMAIVRATLDSPCGLDDDLFGLGLTSLVSLSILAQIRDEFGVRVRLRDFYRARTSRNLAELISDVG